MKAIGIDLGGTKVKGGLFDDGYLLKISRNSTDIAHSREEVVLAVKKTIDELMVPEVGRIGIVSAGDIDPEKGLCTLAYNIPGWTGCPIKAVFEDLYHLPVFVENDAMGALWGELTLLPEKKNVTMLTFGTGVGGASIIDGKLSRSSKTAWGHVNLIPNGRACTCGQKGCAEMYLSANALLALAQEKIPTLHSTIELNDLYMKGNPAARMVMKQYADWLNLFLNKITEEVHPALIILGGGLMNAKMMKGLIRLPSNRYLFAQLGNQAGIVGAQALPIPQ